MKRVYSPDKIYAKPEYVSGGIKPHGFVQETEEYDFFHKRVKKVKPTKERSSWKLTNQDDATYYEAKAYEEQVQKCQFLDFEYPQAPDLMPFIYFYKFMARKPEFCKKDMTKFQKLELWIPDTIVYNDSDAPYWIFTNHDGVICRTENFNERHIVSKLGNQYSIDELVAVCKSIDNTDGRIVGNKCQLMSTRDLAQRMSSTNSGNSELYVIQKFVKSKGPNAFIIRAHYRRNKPPQCYVITNKTSFFDSNSTMDEQEKYMTNVKKPLSCSIVHSKGGKVSEEGAAQVEKIIKFFEKYTGNFLEEMVCDFIKDESGLWWFIGCRGFKQNGNNGKPTLKFFTLETHILSENSDDEDAQNKKLLETMKGSKSDYTKLRMCRFCQIGYPVNDLSHQMTLLMILKTEKHIKIQQLGSDYEWLNHGEQSYYDQVSLYQPHRVCKTCFNLYKEVEQLKRVERQFAKALGIPIDQIGGNEEEVHKPDPFELLSQKKEGESDIKEIMIEKLYRYRIIIVFHEITDFDFNLQSNKRNNLILEYSVLNASKSYRLHISPQYDQSARLGTININKIKMYYYFLKDNEKSFMKFIQKEKVKVRLLCDNVELAQAEYSLKEFRSPYVTKIGMNSMLCGQNNQSCYLKFYIGMSGTENPVDVREINIRNYKNYIYLGQENYYACEVLPEDWIDILPSNSKKNTLQLQARTASIEDRTYQGRLSSPIKNNANAADQQHTLFKSYNKKQIQDKRETSQPKQPSQKKSKSKTKNTFSKTLRNSNTTANLHDPPSLRNVLKNMPDIRIKNIKQSQKNSSIFNTLQLNKNASSTQLVEKKRPETSQPRARKLKDEDAILSSKLKLRLEQISAINYHVEYGQYQNGASSDYLRMMNSSLAQSQLPAAHSLNMPQVFTFKLTLNQLLYDPTMINASPNSQIFWVAQIEIFNQKFVSDMLSSVFNNRVSSDDETLLFNFRQLIHIQETQDNLQNILMNNFMVIKVSTTQGHQFQSTFNLGYLIQNRQINTQLILQSLTNQNEFVRLQVEFEVEEDDLTVLRGKKTMRQTVNNSTTVQSSSFDDTVSNKYQNLQQFPVLKPFEVIIPF